jgi:hypothetical protein
MSLHKSSLLKAFNRVALFLVTGALLTTGVVPAAQAAEAKALFVNFEAADPLKSLSANPALGPFGGATSEIKASTRLTGDSLHFTKTAGSEVWAGNNILLKTSTVYRYTDSINKVITFDYWSNDTAPSPVMVKVEGQGAALKTVEAQPGLNKLSVDMSTGTGWSPTSEYTMLIIFPNFGADDRTYTGAGPVANTGQVYEIDNISINGGTPTDLYVAPPKGKDATSTLLTFEAADTLGAKVVGDSSAAKVEGGFAGATTTIEDAPTAGNGGKALKIVKNVGAEVYAGANILNLTTERITDGTNKKVTFNYFSPKADSPVRVELVPYPRGLGKTVTVPQGWSTVTVDFTDVATWSSSEEYTSLAIFPDFNVAAGAVAQSYFVDNIAINGATTPEIRFTPVTLINFESNDTSGYSLTDFGGNSSSVATDAPADGSVGSTKALKIVTAGEAWAGTTFITKGAGASLISAGNFVVKANIYSPLAGKRIALKIESSKTPSQNIEKDATSTSVVGWKTYSFDFTIGGSLAVDYDRASIFVDYGTPKGAAPWYVDDIAFNGATGAALGGVVQPPVGGTSVLVNFESTDSSGFALVDFGGNSASKATDAPTGGSVGSTSALKMTTAGESWAGTTFLTGTNSLLATGKSVVTANIYSPAAGKTIKLKLENAVSKVNKEVDVVSVEGWKTYTFDFAGFDTNIVYNMATIFVDFGGSKTANPWYADDFAFLGATGAALGGVVQPPVGFTGNANVRLVGMDDTNSFNRPADAAFFSVANPWYRVGINVRTKQVPVGSTQTLTYLVTNAADNTPLANQTVTFTMGKQYSGSNAKVNVGDVASVGEQNKTVTGVTNSEGRVTFSMVNTDDAANAANNPGENLGADFTGTKLFTQATAWVTSQTQDSIDLVDFIFFKPAAVVEPPVPFTGNANVRLVGMDDTNSFNRPADAAFFSVANPWYRVGINVRTKQVPVGSTQALTYLVTNAENNAPLANTTVTLVLGKQYSGSNAKVKVGAVDSVGETNKTVTGVTNSEGKVTFSLVNSDVAADAANNPGANLGADFTGKKLFTQVTAWVNSQTQDSIDLVDFIFFKPADAPVTKTAVSRLTGVNSTNAWISEGEGWFQYYAAGIRYIQRGVEVGKTTSLSFTVNDTDGAPYANKTVKLLLGKTYSGSSAKVAVNGTAFPGVGDEKVIEFTTDANGVITFDVSNSNFTADADPYQAANVKNPEGSKKLFVQIAVVGEKGNQDVLDIVDLFYYQAQSALPPTVYNARLADWNASNSFDGTKVWGDAGLTEGWFDKNTGYFARYVATGSTFNLRYRVTNSVTGANAPDGTVVTLTLGAAWSGSNAKFTAGSTVIDGKTKWGANGQLDQGYVTATVVNGIASVSLTSNDVAEDGTENPGNPKANPTDYNPLFMQVKIKVEGNAITQQDWVNIVATKPVAAAPTIASVSAKSGRKGDAIDIVGTNLGDALGHSVSLFTAATTKVAAITTPVTVIFVNAAGTRMTVQSPAVTRTGTFRVTTTAGTASAPAVYSASASTQSKPSITMAASLVREVGSEISLSGNNLASSTSITIGSVNAPFRIVTATTVVITVPAGVVSGSKISATNAGGTTITSKYVYQAAVVATTTASAKVGQTVTITGSSLKATSVVFGGNKSAKPVINDGETITVVVPTGALTGLIKITTGAGIVYTKSFTVVPPTPTVTSFTPTTGKKGVTAVTVRGTALTGATVTIGSTPVTLSAGASSTSLKFVIPAGATSGKITVTTAGGSATSAATLTIN